MKFALWLAFWLEVAGLVFGLYSLTPADWPLHVLSKSEGLQLAFINAAMAMTLVIVRREYEARAQERNAANVWDACAPRLGGCVAMHEREFYALWVVQVASARNNIDVTHLGKRRPQNRHGDEEARYFRNMKTLYSDSRAHVRRVERWTPEKAEWIRELVRQFTGVPNVSLRVYKDHSTEEMPVALSVSRIDNRYAWIVAMAEQESTSNVRDLLITGSESVGFVARYFEERLWRVSVPVITHGVVEGGWEATLRA